jgi:hypothetical protein
MLLLLPVCQTGVHWDDRWLVFDLENGAIFVYETSREMRTQIKARIPMAEVVSAEAARTSASHEFVINSAKRAYQLRAHTKEKRDFWVAVINTVAPSMDSDGRWPGSPGRTRPWRAFTNAMGFAAKRLKNGRPRAGSAANSSLRVRSGSASGPRRLSALNG